MNKWLTLMTFNLASDAHLVRTKLESEGIPVIIQDELTAQLDIYAQAIGGIKLQVQRADWERAYQLLKEVGYIKERKQTQKTWMTKLDRFTSGFPLIGKSVLELRLVVLITLILAIVMVPVLLVILP